MCNKYRYVNFGTGRESLREKVKSKEKKKNKIK